MRYFYCITCLLFLVCCSRHETKSPEQIKRGTSYNAAINSISKSQKIIEDLVDSFKLQHNRLYSESAIDSLVENYNKKLFNFLSTGMDSILVHVDSVSVKDLTVTTMFHLRRDIGLKYELRFKKFLTNKQDSLFRFMKGLIPGTDTLINFQYMGSHQFSDPHDTSSYTLKIFALPTPFSSKE